MMGLQSTGGGSPANSHMQGHLQDPMHMPGGSGGLGMMAGSYDGGEMTELKKRR